MKENLHNHCYVHSQEDPSGGWENEKITKGLWDELISELHGSCRKAAEVCNLFSYCISIG